MEIKILEAAWVLPVTSPPIKNAAVLVAGPRIEAVAPAAVFTKETVDSNCVRYNYGQAVIVPGFINLHAHLEYTTLQSLSAEGGFLAWLPRLMEATAGWSFSDRLHSIEQGIKEIIAAGTTFIVDNSYTGASAKAIAQAGIRGLIGLEIFGVDQAAIDRQWQHWELRHKELLNDKVVAEAINENRIGITVAPHAPYTVCPALWHKAGQWAKTNKQILLTHLAESPAESQWFGGASTELTEFLIYAFSRQDPDFVRSHTNILAWKKDRLSATEHLHKHNLLADNMLAAHVVHVDDQDIDLLKAKSVAVAHCPRSNARLGCGRAPLGKMLASGLKIGLGTDSKASNDNLDLLAEAGFAANLHKEHFSPVNIGSKQIIECLTIRAAECLKRENEIGSLEPGKLADIAVFSLPTGNTDPEPEDFYDLLLGGGLELRALFVDGKEIQMNI